MLSFHSKTSCMRFAEISIDCRLFNQTRVSRAVGINQRFVRFFLPPIFPIALAKLPAMKSKTTTILVQITSPYTFQLRSDPLEEKWKTKTLPDTFCSSRTSGSAFRSTDNFPFRKNIRIHNRCLGTDPPHPLGR